MDVSQYLADSPPTVVPLAIKPHFEAGLTDEQKLYAHHISKYVESLLVGHFFSVEFLNNTVLPYLPIECHSFVLLVLEFCTFTESSSISVFLPLDLKLHDQKRYSMSSLIDQ